MGIQLLCKPKRETSKLASQTWAPCGVRALWSEPSYRRVLLPVPLPAALHGRGLWAAITTIDEAVEWRPPLLYVDPLGHASCHCSNLAIFAKTVFKYLYAVHAVRMFRSGGCSGRFALQSPHTAELCGNPNKTGFGVSQWSHLVLPIFFCTGMGMGRFLHWGLGTTSQWQTARGVLISRSILHVQILLACLT